MNIAHKNLFWTFLVSLALNFALPIAWPSMRLFFLAPFLIILFYQKPFSTCLWASFLCGLLFDLLSSRTHFGFYGLSYTLTTCLLYQHRSHFFGDNLSTLPLMSFFFSVLLSLIQSFLMYALGHPFIPSGLWIFTDLFLMPLFDGLYAFVFFILPWRLFGKPQRQTSEYFL